MEKKNIAFKIALLTLLFVFSIVSLTACSAAEQFFVYGTFLDVSAEGDNSRKLVKKIAEYIEDLEPVLSPTIKGSDVYKINAAGENRPIVCRQVTMDVLRIAENVYRASGGAYDPSVYPLVKLWKFDGASFTLPGLEKSPPTQTEIDEVLPLIGLSKAFSIDYDNCTVTKNTGYKDAMLDLGGVVKGYAADTARAFIGEQKVIINLGGNIAVKNKEYNIGIGNPRNSDKPFFGSLRLTDGMCISTSGDYERYYSFKTGKGTSDEKTLFYHHILNPSTGYPTGYDKDGNVIDDAHGEIVISVSVITSDGALGDALSTAVMVLGKTEGTALLNSLGVKAVIIDKNLNYTNVGDVGFVKK